MSNFQEFKTWIKKVSFLTDDDCNLFEPLLKKTVIENKQIILSEGQVCREMGFINYGAFRLYYLSDGKEINTHFCFENEFVMDYDSFLAQKPSRYYIQAIEPSEIVTFNLSTLEHAYQNSQNWERFGRIMAEYSYKVTTQRVESFLFMDGEQRYIQLLKSQPHIFERVPLYHIASYLGLERESLSRLRKKIVQKKRL
jgi:CRP/FNR family transcriptional regulator, anaerobic regulatory protein